MSREMEIPKTKTPWFVLPTLVVLAVAMGIFFWFLFGVFWGVSLLLGTIAFTTGFYTQTVQGFDAHIVLNHLTGVQRALFQGLNLKLPWEEVQDEAIDLKTDLKEVVEQTWQSKDAKMDTKYVYTIRPDYSGDNAGEKIILYASFEREAIRMEGRALFSQLLSDYYRGRVSKNLKGKEKIQEKVFGPLTHGRARLEEFEADYGVEVDVTLEDSDVDEATQAVLDSAAKTEAMGDAAKVLEGKGWNKEVAQKTVRQLNIPNLKEYIISLDAKGLEELRHFSMLGGLPGDDDKKGGKK